ncbi:MAG: hypothetical protein COC01_08695 [Bacteroidetes bacterium]|nr:MAG: hypothetical protein COC01_08695 [Bacteroidota bacterium]
MYKSQLFKKREKKLRVFAHRLVIKALNEEMGSPQYLNYMHRYRFICYLLRLHLTNGMYPQKWYWVPKIGYRLPVLFQKHKPLSIFNKKSY